MSTFELDVTSEESIAACKKQVTELTGGTLDVLVNNA
jgi:1-acylglycerone phosphate reductase